MRDITFDVIFTSRDSEAVNRYLNELERLPLITPGQEARLAAMVRNGDRSAEEALIKANLRFVVSVAKRYQHLGFPLADLISEGNIGLITAARRFDERRGFKFISYAVSWIRHHILEFLSENARTIRLPKNQVESMQTIYHAGSKLEQALERSPTVDELTDHLQFAEWQVKAALYQSPTTFSYDRDHGSGDEGQTFLELMAGEKEEDDEFDWPYLLSTLSEQELDVITLSFGFREDREHSVPEICKKLQLGTIAVRRAEHEGLKKLRHLVKAG